MRVKRRKTKSTIQLAVRFSVVVLSTLLTACYNQVGAPVSNGWTTQTKTPTHHPKKVVPGNKSSTTPIHHFIKQNHPIKQVSHSNSSETSTHYPAKPVLHSNSSETSTHYPTKPVLDSNFSQTPTHHPIKLVSHSQSSTASVASQSKPLASTVQKPAYALPAAGRIVRAFSPQDGGNTGVDIAGRVGEPVRAVKPGKVVYAGSSLLGYGNLILLQHDGGVISAYALNQSVLVKVGQRIKKGQQIATMGEHHAGEGMLHFEIRHHGKAINPVGYLE